MLNFSYFNVKSYKNVQSLLFTMKTCGLIWIEFNKHTLFKITNVTLFFPFFKGLQMSLTWYNVK
jgi:hypothetical protein